MKKLMKFNVLLTVAVVAFLSVSYVTLADDNPKNHPLPNGINTDNNGYWYCTSDLRDYWQYISWWSGWDHYRCGPDLYWDRNKNQCNFYEKIEWD